MLETPISPSARERKCRHRALDRDEAAIVGWPHLGDFSSPRPPWRAANHLPATAVAPRWSARIAAGSTTSEAVIATAAASDVDGRRWSRPGDRRARTPGRKSTG